MQRERSWRPVEGEGGTENLYNSWPHTHPVFMSTESPVFVFSPHTSVGPKSSWTRGDCASTWEHILKDPARNVRLHHGAHGHVSLCAQGRQPCPCLCLPQPPPGSPPKVPDRTAEEAVLSSHIANSVFSTLQLPRPQREQRLSQHLVNQEERGHQLLSLSTCPECLMKEPLLPSGLAVQGYFMWPRMSVRVSKYPFLVWIVAVLAFGMFRILVARTHKISWKEAG